MDIYSYENILQSKMIICKKIVGSKSKIKAVKFIKEFCNLEVSFRVEDDTMDKALYASKLFGRIFKDCLDCISRKEVIMTDRYFYMVRRFAYSVYNILAKIMRSSDKYIIADNKDSIIDDINTCCMFNAYLHPGFENDVYGALYSRLVSLLSDDPDIRLLLHLRKVADEDPLSINSIAFSYARNKPLMDALPEF